MEFWGVEVKAGKPLTVQPELGKLIHVSQASLGEVKKDASKGVKNIPLRLKIDGKDFIIGNLSPEDRPQLAFDLVFEKEFELSHDLKTGSVYFICYSAEEQISDNEGGFGSDDSEDESEDELVEAKENVEAKTKPVEKAPAAVAVTNGAAKAAKAAPAAKAVVAKKQETSDSDDDEDDSEDEMAIDESLAGDSSDDLSGQEEPEFVLINKEPEPDPENPSQLIYTEDPLILHTPTGRIINYVDDEEHGIRLFWQPPVEEGEDVNPDDAQFLPLGFDEFYGREETVEEKNMWVQLVTSVEKACKPVFDRLEKWSEEKKKEGKSKMEMLEKEMELMDAEMSLKEAIEDFDQTLKMLEKEESKVEEEDVSLSESVKQSEETVAEEGEGEEEDDGDENDDDDDDNTPSSFGTIEGQSSGNGDGNKSNGKSTFASLSLSFGCSSIVSLAPPKLGNSFLGWRKEATPEKPASSHAQTTLQSTQSFSTVTFPPAGNNKSLKMRFKNQTNHRVFISKLKSRNLYKGKTSIQPRRAFEVLNILSWHTPVTML